MLETLYHAQGEMENEWLHHEMHVYMEEGVNIWEDIMRRKAYDKKQIDTLYKLMYKIEREKEKTNSHTYEWAELDKELSALRCAIFELENQ